MSDTFELHISDISEIEAQELQNEIEEQTQASQPVEISSEPLPNSSTSGDPGLVHALLQYGPQVVPPLVAALAAWISAGRRKKASQARRLVITRNGIVYADVKVSDLERESSSKPLETVLTSLLEGTGHGSAGETPVK